MDAVIDAVERKDAVRLSQLFSFYPEPCTTLQGVGVGPHCPAGEPQGSPVDVVQLVRCEGEYIQRDSDLVLSALSLLNSPPPVDGLNSVAYVTMLPPYRPPASMVIIYASGHSILIDDQGITGFNAPCGTPRAPTSSPSPDVRFLLPPP